MLDFKKSMKVKSLIELLQDIDPEKPVIISESTCNFHNICVSNDDLAIVLVSMDKLEKISENEDD